MYLWLTVILVALLLGGWAIWLVLKPKSKTKPRQSQLIRTSQAAEVEKLLRDSHMPTGNDLSVGLVHPESEVVDSDVAATAEAVRRRIENNGRS